MESNSRCDQKVGHFCHVVPHIGWEQRIHASMRPMAWSLVLCPSLSVLSPFSKQPSPSTILLPSRALHIPLSIRSIPPFKTKSKSHLLCETSLGLSHVTTHFSEIRCRVFFVPSSGIYYTFLDRFFLIYCSISFMFNLPSDTANYLKSRLNLLWYLSSPEQ